MTSEVDTKRKIDFLGIIMAHYKWRAGNEIEWLLWRVVELLRIGRNILFQSGISKRTGGRRTALVGYKIIDKCTEKK